MKTNIIILIVRKPRIYKGVGLWIGSGCVGCCSITKIPDKLVPACGQIFKGKLKGAATLRIWKGEFENLSVGLANDLSITIRRGDYGKLEPSMDIDKDIEAPVEKGQKVGVVKVSLDGELLASVPLVALETVNEGSFLQKAKDYVLRLLE